MTEVSNQELERAPTVEPLLESDDDGAPPVILDEVKIEEISIDGMCGVY